MPVVGVVLVYLVGAQVAELWPMRTYLVGVLAGIAASASYIALDAWRRVREGV